ncbi:aminotransferase class V-fold PLP-dependent enzyme [Clostridioides difficile]|nr:aminotransferase class V-fold PLP-dependent enzyme [Clostridioides difficile]
MKTYPLKSISVKEAAQLQFRLIDEITKEFKGGEILTRGDLGVVKGLNKPKTTLKVEKVLAKFFNSEKAMLVRGAGTMSIRMALYSSIKRGNKVLIHKAPVYPTTSVSIDMLGIHTVGADFNNLEEIKCVLKRNEDIKGAIVQYTRQQPQDSYEVRDVIKVIKEVDENIVVITDDNYAVMKVPYIGVEGGADLSCFSLFKILGSEGIGCIVGKEKYINKLIKENYSGGLQVQGYEAIDSLKGLVYAPVMLAIQAEVSENIVKRLLNKEIEGVSNAFIANAQSKVILVELEEEIADKVLEEAEKLGAAPNPVGAESKYEFVPMFYRLSGTFRSYNPSLSKRMIRINPLRSGEDTVLRILEESINNVKINK